MADSKRLRVLKALCAHMELTSGYEGIKVHRGKSIISALELADTMSILEVPRPIPSDGVGHNNLVRKPFWPLYLQGWPKDDKENPSDPAYAMVAAAEKRLSRLIDVDDTSGLPRYPSEYLLGGELLSLTIGDPVVRPPSEEAASRLAMFILPLTLEIVTDVRNP